MTTEEAVQELARLVVDPDGASNFRGVLRCWAELVLGQQDEGDRWGLATGARPDGVSARQAWALERMQRGGVTSGDIARRFDVTAETARLDLTALVEKGLAQRHGERRGTYYTLRVLAEVAA